MFDGSLFDGGSPVVPPIAALQISSDWFDQPG
jgi:hypothetical protein